MRTERLEAVLVSEVEVVSINRRGRKVTLLVDGEQVALRVGDKALLTLHGRFDNARTSD